MQGFDFGLIVAAGNKKMLVANTYLYTKTSVECLFPLDETLMSNIW